MIFSNAATEPILTGRDDPRRLQQAQVLGEYFASEQMDMSDGIYYSESASSVEACNDQFDNSARPRKP
jgi:hypothetical protein